MVALPVKAFKPNFVTFFMYCIWGTACWIICEISLFVTAVNQETILLETYASLAPLT